MDIKKTGKVSFRSNPIITTDGIWKALPKYKKRLAAGILDSFEKLSKNGASDQVFVNIVHTDYTKKHSADILCISYFSNKDLPEQSSAVLNPRKLEKLSKKAISETVLKMYEKLKISTEKVTLASGSYIASKNKLSKKHVETLEKLAKFSNDDSTGIGA